VAAAVGGASPGAVVLALAIPLLFLHATYQPTLGVTAGGVHVEAALSDFAVLAVVLAATWTGIRDGFAPLRSGRWAWLALAAFLVWIVVAVAYGAARFDAYPARTHLVTAGKWIEYALLAPALPLVLRRRRDFELLLWSLGLWSAAATFVGVLEWFGLDVAAKGTFGKRQASFLGSSDFAALSGAALLAGVVVRERVLRPLLIVSGALGTIIAGSLAGLLGLATAFAVLAVALLLRGQRRPLVPLVAMLAVVAAGSIAIRTADLSAFQRFLGGEPARNENPNKVQTYAHRTLLAYIGGRIWLDHPVLGVGWEGSNDPYAYLPYVDDAKRKFPDESPLAFPTRERSYGVQNVYLQALADLGVIGLAALLALLGAAFALAARAWRSEHGRIAALWLLLVAWLWTAQGFVAGIPLDALTWLAVGLAATLPSRTRHTFGASSPPESEHESEHEPDAGSEAGFGAKSGHRSDLGSEAGPESGSDTWRAAPRG
jgi:O-antigen ligase